MSLIRIFLLYRGCPFYYWKKPENYRSAGKMTDKMYDHMKLYESKVHFVYIQTCHWNRSTFSSFKNCIGGVMNSVTASSMVDHGFEPQSDQTKDY